MRVQSDVTLTGRSAVTGLLTVVRRSDLRQPGAVIGRLTITPRDPLPRVGLFQPGAVIGRLTIAPRDPQPLPDPARFVPARGDMCQPGAAVRRLPHRSAPDLPEWWRWALAARGPDLARDARHLWAPVRGLR